MQDLPGNPIEDTKRFLKWAEEHWSYWGMICGQYPNTAYIDQMEVIKALWEEKFYTELLIFVSNPNNRIEEFAQNAVLDEIMENWGKEQWDNVVKKLLAELDKARREQSRRQMIPAAEQED